MARRIFHSSYFKRLCFATHQYNCVRFKAREVDMTRKSTWLLAGILSILLMLLPTVAYAQNETLQSRLNDSNDYSTIEVLIPVIESDLSFEEFINSQEASSLLNRTSIEPRSGVASVHGAVFRSGPIGNYSLQLTWQGSLYFNQFSLTRAIVKSPSLIDTTTYCDLYKGGSPYYYPVSAATSGYFEVTRFSMPDNIDQVYLRTENLKGYDLLNGWLSFINDHGIIHVLG